MANKINLLNGVYLLLTICVFVLLISSCRSTDGGENQRSHFYASIHGPSLNGEFRIEEDVELSTLKLTGLIYPATETNPAIALMFYNNYEGFWGTIQVPPEEKLSELTDNHDFFAMTMVYEKDDVIMISKALSMNVTRFKSNNLGGITEMRANFEGIMVYKKPDNTEESHTVKGELEFYSMSPTGIQVPG